MLLLEYNGHIKPRANQVGAGAGAELEHMARITTFIIVFISIFCGWPCLLHFMAGFAKTGVVLSSVTGRGIDRELQSKTKYAMLLIFCRQYAQ